MDDITEYVGKKSVITAETDVGCWCSGEGK